MNNPKKLKLSAAAIFFSVLWIGLSNTVAAQEANSSLSSNSVYSLYEKYEQSRFAVQWKVPSGDLSALLAIMPRESFLMYYTSGTLLADPQGPYVQFGFFKSADEAKQFVNDNKTVFPNLRVVDVNPAEHLALMHQARANSSEEKKVANRYYWLGGSGNLGQSAVSSLLSEAKEFYMNKRYDKALGYYDILSLAADPSVSVWARELKGLCEEQLGQNEQALQTYRQLLAVEKGESWVGRVTQRLRTLETATEDDKSALRKSKYRDDQTPFYYRGVIGQFYRYATVNSKDAPSRDVLSVIATNLDATAGYHHTGHEMVLRVSGYSNSDLMTYPKNYPWDTDNRSVLKRAQVEYTNVAVGIKATGGRQQDSDSGQYMHFDGLTVKYPVNNKITLGVNAGIPVQFTDYYDTLDHQFYSLQASYDHNKHWRAAGYFTQQTLYGEIDRAAWGGRLQYTDDRFSSYLNLDYDYEFAELNLFRWTGTYNVNRHHQLSATYGLQRSPFLTSTNILLGQPYLNIEEHLSVKFNEDYLLYNALQRTGINEYGSVSYQYIVDEKLQITTDIYQSVSSHMPIFQYDGVFLTSTVVSNDSEYRDTSVGVQAVVTDFFGGNDTATLSFRHGDSTFMSSNFIQVSERLRLWGDKFFVIPKLNLKATQKNKTDSNITGGNSSNVGGAIAVTYKPWSNVELRLEGGNDAYRYLDRKTSVGTSYLFAGYQARF